MNLSFCKLRSNLIAYFLILSHIFNFYYCSNTNILRIIGAVNQTASIPCPVYNINDSIDLILWFKGNQESALYSLDARTTPIERAKQNPIDESFSRRAYIDVSKKPSALIINNIQKEDAGIYKCRVDFRKNRTQYRTIRLNVIDAPKTPTIIDADGQTLKDVIGPYNEGGHLILICETESTDSSGLNLYWYRNDELIDTSYEETEQRVIRNELTILRLAREHLLNKFTCKAINSNLTISKFASVLLELNLRPLKVRIIGPNHPVNSGDKVTLICESEGARPNATISWWTRNENYEDNNIEKSDYFSRKNIKDSYISSTLISSDSSSKLNLYVNESFNNKQIICRADHPILGDSAIEDVFTLNVNYPPKVSLTIGSSSSREQIYEKSDIKLICHVNSNPKPNSILWYFNNEPISKSNFVYYENQTELLIQNVGIDHNGNFSCLAIAESGSGVSDQTTLKVLYSPICSSEKTVYGVSTLEPIEVECKVNSVPPAHTFYWALNSSSFTKPMSLHSFHNQIKGHLAISTLNYSAKTHLGYGSLLCYAVNSVGKQQEPCTFEIKPGSIPEKLDNCIVGNQTLSTLFIKCEAGYDGGLEQKFFLEIYRTGSGKLVRKINSTKPVFIVDGLPRSTTFVLMLYSANAKGKSDQTTFITSTLPFPNKELIIITPLIAVLIGIMACFIFTAVSIVIISKIKNPEKQTKKKYLRNKSSFSQPETNEEDTTSNLSDLVFNNQATLKYPNNDNNHFHHAANSTNSEFYTTLELAKNPSYHKTNSLNPYKQENLSSFSSLSNKRYIMITNQNSNIQQLNESNLPINRQDNGGVSVTDQSPITNFLLFQN